MRQTHVVHFVFAALLLVGISYIWAQSNSTPPEDAGAPSIAPSDAAPLAPLAPPLRAAPASPPAPASITSPPVAVLPIPTLPAAGGAPGPALAPTAPVAAVQAVPPQAIPVLPPASPARIMPQPQAPSNFNRTQTPQEALQAWLWQQPVPPQMVAPTALPAPSREWLEFQRHEQETAQLAVQYRQAIAQAAPEERQRDLKERLAKAVQQAFDTRNKAYDEQVQQLKDRLKRVEENLGKRNAARDRIIAERVDELLGEPSALHWNSDPLVYGRGAGVPAAGSNLGIAPPIIADGSQGASYPAQIVPSPNTPMRAPGRQPGPAAAAPARMRYAPVEVPQTSQLNPAAQGVGSGLVESTSGSGRRDYLESSLANLASARRAILEAPKDSVVQKNLEDAKKRLASDLEFFRFDLDEAKLLLHASESKLREAAVESERNPGTAQKYRLQTEQYAVDLAKLRVDRLNHLRERYEKALAETGDSWRAEKPAAR